MRVRNILMMMGISLCIFVDIKMPARGDSQSNFQKDESFIYGMVLSSKNDPLVGARVGIRGEIYHVETDGSGKFALPIHHQLKRDSAGVYEYIEIDKDGYIGETISLTDTGRIDVLLTEILHPIGVQQGRAAFSTRLPLATALNHMPTAKPNTLIPVQAWADYFASLRPASAQEPSGQVLFEAYVPPDIQHVKAVFLMTRHGIGSVDIPSLRLFAERNHVALIAVKGRPVQTGFYPFNILDPYIAKLGTMLGHPELSTVPVITFGHSNGTWFSSVIAAQMPNRTIAWISYHSGDGNPLQIPGTESIPSLVLHGLRDPFFQNGQAAVIEQLRKERNAETTFVVEPYVPHFPIDKEQAETWQFIADYAEAVMRTRLDETGSVRPMSIETGWLGTPYDISAGGLQSLEIAPYSSYQGDRGKAVWLPDEVFARIWKRYEETDPRKK